MSSSIVPRLSAIAAALMTPVAFAQQTEGAASSGTAASVDSVVIIGRTTNADIAAPALEHWQANDLADVFRTVPSVSVGGSVGIAQKVYVRGLEDTLLNITVDGAPQTGTLFHHIGRVAVEPELLERVEVQAGAGEATSGFGAIGGAIRFRTKDAADLLARDQRIGALVKAGYFSNDGNKASLSAFGELTDRWSLLGSYVRVDRDDMEDGAGNTLYGTEAEQSLAFLKAGGELSDTQRFTLSYERRDEKGAFGQRPNWPALAGDPLFPGAAERETIVANYSLTANDALQIEATVYTTESYFEQNRFDRWGLYGATIETSGFDIRNTTRLRSHEVSYGIEQRNDEVVSLYSSDSSVWSDWAWDASVGQFEENGDLLGVYVQDHFRVSDPLLLSFGMRYDAYDLEQITYGDGTDSDGVSFNAGMLLDLTQSVSLSLGVAEAMRGKEIGDAFTLERRPGRINFGPSLAPEEVVNREIGLAFAENAWFASATLFSVEIDDVVQDQLGGGPPPQDAVFFENVGTLESDGFELKLGYTTARIRTSLLYTQYDAELNGNTVEGYEHIGLGNASGDKWNASFAYAPSDAIEIGWNLAIVEDLDDIVVLQRAVEIGWIDTLQTVDKDGYSVHDAYLQWRPRGNATWKFNLTVQNLFDEHYRDHASVADYNAIPDWEGVAGLYEAGRDIRLSATASF